MYDELERRGPTNTFGSSKYLVSRLETRHILVDELLANTQHPQVLEVAAGYDTRGLSWALAHPGRYVEFDREDVTAMKQSIIETISPRDVPNLRFVEGNAINKDDLCRAVEQVHPHHPMAVITEGLMMYLSPDERAQLTSHIRTLLLQRGGTWITPDVVLRAMLEDTFVTPPGKMEQVSDLTSSDIYGHAFGTIGEGADFFRGIGFDVEVLPFSTVEHMLTSPARLGFTDEEVSRANQYSHALVMTVRTK